MGGRGAWWQREIVHIHYDRIGLGRRRSGTGTAAESRWHCNLTGMFPNRGNKAARHKWRMPSVLKEINCELEGNVVHTVIEYYWRVEHERPGPSHGRLKLGAERDHSAVRSPDQKWREFIGMSQLHGKDIRVGSVCACACSKLTPEVVCAARPISFV